MIASAVLPGRAPAVVRLVSAFLFLSYLSSCQVPPPPESLDDQDEELPEIDIQTVVARTYATSPAGTRDDGAATIIDIDGWSYCRGPSLDVTNFGEEGEIWRGPIGLRPNRASPSHQAEFTVCFGPTREVDRNGYEPLGPSFRFMPHLRATPDGYAPWVLLRFPRDEIPKGSTMDDVDLAVFTHPRACQGPQPDPSWMVLRQIRFLGPPGTGEFSLGYWSRANWIQPVVKTHR